MKIPDAIGELLSARRHGERVLGVLVVLGVLLVAGGLAAVPAQADTMAYLENLHDLGINVPGGDLELKERGWEACALFDMGLDYEKVRAQAVYDSRSRPPYGLTVGQADAIVNGAAAHLCKDKR